jgi:hypothetical protein
MTLNPSRSQAFKRPTLAGAAALALGLTCIPASATSFSAFVEHNLGNVDVLVNGDGYPGRMKLLNRRGNNVCVYFRFLDQNNQVLRLSPTGAKVPAGREDLSVTGPGVNARRLEIHVEAQPWACGRFERAAQIGLTSVAPGEVKKSAFGFEVDARSWSGNSRDITVHIR